MGHTFILRFLLLTSVVAFIFLIKGSYGSRAYVAATRKECSDTSEKESLDRCFRKVLREAVRKEGTKGAVSVLELLRKEGVIDATFDDHQHVHEIGRETARLFGLSVDAFLLCPTTYNYGCQHGFFEYGLSQSNSYEEAATRICEGIGKNRPPKLYAYCYHGVGHGLMMALSYNLEEVLSVCNNLPNQTAQESCWQGTFMEQANLAVTDQRKVHGFSRDDPLSPCNKVAKRYTWQCYINHAGYLMKVTKLNLKEAADICLSAIDKTGRQACIQSIGLMVTNPIWQKSVKAVDTARDAKKNVAIAWELCRQMPSETWTDCVIGAIGNILNFDETRIERAVAFCTLVDATYKDACFGEIGNSLLGQVRNPKQVETICKRIHDRANRAQCLAGTTREKKAQEEKRLITDDDFLKQVLRERGPHLVVARLAELMPTQNLSCHDRAHEVGRFAYEIFSDQAFKGCSSECHSGCYHGAAEAFFKDKGTENLQANLSLLCQNERNRFSSHQCIHGLGHGLMAFTNYELFDALNACDTLSKEEAQSSCATGVFMENIVGSLSKRHSTRYINADPHYPCTIIPEKYRGSCYFLQTSRMLQLFGEDFGKVAKTCSQIGNIDQKKSCFQSMGRDVGGTSKRNVPLAIEKCQHAPPGVFRRGCIAGAVQDTFWDPTGQSEALSFCSLLTDKGEVKTCYETIGERASEILAEGDYRAFCQKIPNNSAVACGVPKQAHVAPTTLITIKEDGYQPKELTVKRETKVTFRNDANDERWPASNIHPTHRIYPEFDPRRPIKKAETWEFIFEKAGTFYFHDHLFPSLTGKITVVDQ